MGIIEFKKHIIICDCGAPEHQVILTYDPYEDEPLDQEIWLEFHLNQWRNIFRRLWVAIRYVFGYTSKYGQWDMVILNRQMVIDLRSFLGKSLERTKYDG